jgi:hypothetical protein
MSAGKAGAVYCRGFAFGGRLERYRRPLAGVAYCWGVCLWWSARRFAAQVQIPRDSSEK